MSIVQNLIAFVIMVGILSLLLWFSVYVVLPLFLCFLVGYSIMSLGRMFMRPKEPEVQSVRISDPNPVIDVEYEEIT